MSKLYTVVEIVDVLDDNDKPTGEKRISNYDTFSTSDREAAVTKARQKATKYIGDTYGIFELTGTVTHPIPELDVTPVTA